MSKGLTYVPAFEPAAQSITFLDQPSQLADFTNILLYSKQSRARYNDAHVSELAKNSIT